MTIQELTRFAKVTRTEKNAKFDYTVLTVVFEDLQARIAFEELDEDQKDEFFQLMSEKHSEETRNDPRY